MREQEHKLEFSEEQLEIFARRMLPEIRKFFADENVQREFKEWQKKQTEINN